MPGCGRTAGRPRGRARAPMRPSRPGRSRPGSGSSARPPTAVRALRAVRPTAAYLIPDFANPTGRLLGDADRERLARALRRAGTTAVVDESLVELGLDAPAPAPFGVHDPGSIAVGSLSKLVWCGLRIGWVRA